MVSSGGSSRRVLVTGASRGVGAAIASAFASVGDRVALNYRRNHDAASKALKALEGTGHILVPGDISDPSDVRSFVDETVEQLGGLDVLVNNAGIYIPHPILKTSYEDWQGRWAKTLEVNLIGPANVTWCAVQHLRSSGRGRIVNVASRGAFRGEPNQPAYGASKAGLVSLTLSLARALGQHRISVTAVAPGWIDTDMASEHLEGPDGQRIRSESPFNRVATANEVAQAVLYLASDQAEFTSGATLDLNGASFSRY